MPAIASFADDIEKPNTLFPGEVTIYPKERHVALAKAEQAKLLADFNDPQALRGRGAAQIVQLV